MQNLKCIAEGGESRTYFDVLWNIGIKLANWSWSARNSMVQSHSIFQFLCSASFVMNWRIWLLIVQIFLLLINLFLISKSDIINTMSVGSVLIMCVVGFWTYFHLALAHGDTRCLVVREREESGKRNGREKCATTLRDARGSVKRQTYRRNHSVMFCCKSITNILTVSLYISVFVKNSI